MANPLYKKLGLKDEQKVVLKSFPENYFDLLIHIPEIEECEPDEFADFIHLFETRMEDLEKSFLEAKTRMKQDGLIWISWPKKTSNVKTDLDYHSIKKLAVSMGLIDVKVSAIDEIWTATKYLIPKKNRT
ncbi:MAG: hypothetical protein ACI9IP_001722 [Arcticibacterium sp.]|jgi:hypothetical protein